MFDIFKNCPRVEPTPKFKIIKKVEEVPVKVLTRTFYLDDGSAHSITFKTEVARPSFKYNINLLTGEKNIIITNYNQKIYKDVHGRPDVYFEDITPCDMFGFIQLPTISINPKHVVKIKTTKKEHKIEKHILEYDEVVPIDYNEETNEKK